jgi:hypothetical protein
LRKGLQIAEEKDEDKISPQSSQRGTEKMGGVAGRTENDEHKRRVERAIPAGPTTHLQMGGIISL